MKPYDYEANNEECCSKVLFWILVLFTAGLLIALAGCMSKPKQPTAVPAAPTTQKVETSIAGAKENTKAAQTNVRTARAEAVKVGATTVTEPLDAADGELTTVCQLLDDANGQIDELNAQAKSREQAIAQEKKDLQTQVAAATKTIAERDKQIADLKNEVLRRTKLFIGGIGGALLLAAGGCVAAFFFLGFTSGLRVAMVCGTVGGIAVTIAIYLTQIVIGVAITLGIGVLAAIGYAAWKMLHHAPTMTIGLKPIDKTPPAAPVAA